MHNLIFSLCIFLCLSMQKKMPRYNFVDKTAEHSENRLWIMAEMERELIVERTRAGLAAAREQGRVGGRRRVMTEDVVEQCRRMLENGATRQQVADVIGVDVKTIYKYLPAT